MVAQLWLSCLKQPLVRAVRLAGTIGIATVPGNTYSFQTLWVHEQLPWFRWLFSSGQRWRIIHHLVVLWEVGGPFRRQGLVEGIQTTGTGFCRGYWDHREPVSRAPTQPLFSLLIAMEWATSFSCPPRLCHLRHQNDEAKWPQTSEIMSLYRPFFLVISCVLITDIVILINTRKCQEAINKASGMRSGVARSCLAWHLLATLPRGLCAQSESSEHLLGTRHQGTFGWRITSVYLLMFSSQCIAIF